MSRYSSSFVEVSLESTLALVCICTMLHNSLSALELTPSVCSFFFFFSCSLDYIWAEHNDTMKTSDTVLRKIYLSLYLKGLYLWEGVWDRTELQYIDPHSYGHQRCVFLVLQSCSTGGPAAHSAGCWLSLPHLVSKNSPNSKLTDFLFSPSYIIVQSPTQYLPITGHRNVLLPPSLEWHVWSSSSGNNCHAAHRSLSSGASVYDCTAGFYLVPYCQPSSPTRFLPITGHRNVSLPLSLEWHVWPGRRSVLQH